MGAYRSPPAILIGTPGTGRHKGFVGAYINVLLHLFLQRLGDLLDLLVSVWKARAPAPLGCLGHRDDPVRPGLMHVNSDCVLLGRQLLDYEMYMMYD